MMPGLLALLVTLIMVTQLMAGTWTPNNFFYKPNVGARGAQEKTIFDSGLDRVDTRLGNENWLNDPAFGGNLQTAIAAIGNTTTVLNIPSGTWPIASDLTIPANITLNLPRGAILNIGTGKTLSINGGLGAGLYQIFSCVGTGKVVFGAGAVKSVYPEWWAANTTPGTTDMTVAIQAAFNTGRPVDFTGGPYLFSATLTPKHNRLIRFFGGAGLKAKADGVYTEMLTAAGAASGLYVLFDCIELGVLLSESNNRNSTLVKNLYINANAAPNTIGIGQSKVWAGTEPEATSPMVTFINPTIDLATWGFYAEASPLPNAAWGQFTGSTFINPTVASCANGMYLGSAHDDITVINLRVTYSTGVSLQISSGGKNIVSAFLNPLTGNGLVIEPGSFNNHFGTIFIESVGAIPVTDYPVKLNAGDISDHSGGAFFECDSLFINYPDGTGPGAGMRKWIFVTNSNNSVKIGSLSYPLGTSYSYVYHLWSDHGTALPTRGHYNIGWANTLATFILGLHSVDATYEQQTRWLTNVRLTAQDGAGTYYGFKFVRDGEPLMDYQTSTSLGGVICRLNAYGLGGLVYKNTTGANVNMYFFAPEAIPVDGQIFKFANSMSSNGTVTFVAGTTAVVLGSSLNVLAIGQSADFAYRASDGKWVQLNRY